MYQLNIRKYWSDPIIPIQFEFRNPQPPFPLHVHDFHELVLVYSGNATHLTIAGERSIQGGDLLSIKLGQAHGYKNIQNLILMNILLKPSFFAEDPYMVQQLPAFKAIFGDEEQEANLEKAPIVQLKLNFGLFSKVKSLVENARAELYGRPDGYRAMVVSLIQELIVLLLRNYKEDEARADFAADKTTLFDYIRENFKSSIRMADLMSVSGMSESNILRIYKRHMGCSPFQYINRLRLDAASDELIQTDKSITFIAMDLGFNDSNYFSRLFRRHTGLSPREYRNKHLVENIVENAIEGGQYD